MYNFSANACTRVIFAENLQSYSWLKSLDCMKTTHLISEPNTDVFNDFKIRAITSETDDISV